MKYTIEVYQDKKKEFRFRIVHRNGRIICNSGEGYKQKSSMKKALIRLAAAVVTNNYTTKNVTK